MVYISWESTRWVVSKDRRTWVALPSGAGTLDALENAHLAFPGDLVAVVGRPAVAKK